MTNSISTPANIKQDLDSFTIPIWANKKQVFVIVSQDKIALSSEDVIELDDSITTKKPELSEMISNLRISEDGKGYVFGVPNEFWVTLTHKNESVTCEVKDRFNKRTLASESILDSI